MHALNLLVDGSAMGIFRFGTDLERAFFLSIAVGFQKVFEHRASKCDTPPDDAGHGHTNKKGNNIETEGHITALAN